MENDAETMVLPNGTAFGEAPPETPRHQTGIEAPPDKTVLPEKRTTEKEVSGGEVKRRLDELILGRTLPVFKKAPRVGTKFSPFEKAARSLLKWIVSAVFGVVLFSLVIEYYYTFVPFQVDPLTMIETPPEGAVIHKSTEGSGVSVFSAHGVVAENPATRDLPNVLFLGSSFTQGLEVDDSEKFTWLFEEYWNKTHEKGLHAVNAGLGHTNLAIHMKRVEGLKKKYDPVFTFVQISKWELIDKLLDPRFSSWVELDDGVPVVRTRNRESPKAVSTLKEILVRTHLFSGFNHIHTNTRAFLAGVSGQSTHEESERRSDIADEEIMQNLIDWQIDEFMRLLPRGFAFIFFSPAPAIQNGKLVLEDPVDRRLAGIFSKACRERGIDFIDMYEVFLDYYLETKQFAKGFFNTRPSIGHMNSAGHELTARRMVDYMQTKEYDFFEH